jgi:hypothetical protein
MLFMDTIRVGPNTYMEVSRACDEAMATPSRAARALLDTFLRDVAFLATGGLDEIRANKANQQCHFHIGTYRVCDLRRRSKVSKALFIDVDLRIRKMIRKKRIEVLAGT